MIKILFFHLFFFTILFSSTINFDNNFKLNYMLDKESKLDIEDISKYDFKKVSENNFSLGYQVGTIWFKFILDNNTSKNNFILSLNEIFYEVANLYYYDNGWIKNSNSLYKKYDERDVLSSDISFNLTLPNNSRRIYYLELKTKNAYFGKVTLSEKYNYSIKFDFLYIIILGINLAILFFVIFLYYNAREKIYFYYFAYILFSIISLLKISGILVFFDLQKEIELFQFSVSFMMAYLVLFLYEYFNIKKYLKQAEVIFKIYFVIFITLGILSLFFYDIFNSLINNLILITMIFLIIISIKIELMTRKKMTFYSFSIILYFIFIGLFTSMVAGFIDYTNISRYGFLYATFVVKIGFLYFLSKNYYTKNNRLKIYLEKKICLRTKKLEQLSKEKGILLKELNHRVKNNYHLLIAMLHLENLKYGNRRDLTEFVDKVKAMALIHEYLYKSESKNILTISVKDYLFNIIDNINSSYGPINIEKNIEDIQMTFDCILSIGIITNEIIINSIKHSGRKDNLMIKVSVSKYDQQINLLIHDNGFGFKNGQKKGIGLMLIDQFVKKIKDAKYDFTFEHGTKFEMNYKMKEINDK